MGLLLWISIVVAVALAGNSRVTEADKQTGLLLDTLNFDEEIKKYKVVLVMFTAKWCKHCQAMLSEWNNAVEELATLDVGKVAMAQVDADESPSLLEQHYVNSYPTFFMFRDGKPYDYENTKNRTADVFIRDIKQYASSKWTPPPDISVNITSDSFDPLWKSGKPMLIDFYAPWCGHCRELAPKFERAAMILKKVDSSITLGKVDCTKETQLAEQNRISSYPILRFFRGGTIRDYHGERTTEAIVEFMKGKVGNASKELPADRKVISKYARSFKNLPATIGFFPDADHEAFQLYDIVTLKLRDNLTFAHVFSSEVGRTFKIKGDYGIIMVQPEHLQSKYEPKVLVLSEFLPDDVDVVEEWIMESARPLVGHVNVESSDTLYHPHSKPYLSLYSDVDFAPGRQKEAIYWRNRLLEIAKDYKDKISFVIADEGPAAGHLNELGFSDDTSDVFITISANTYNYPMHDDFDEDRVREHIDDFLAGKLRPWLRSETIPKPNNGAIKVIVGRSFYKYYDDTSKDLFIMFHAPWCQQCTTFGKTLKAAAKKLKDKKELVFAKYNAIENGIPPEVQIEGYPTCYLKKKGGSELVKFAHGYAVDDIERFVSEHAVSFKSQENDKEEL